MKEYLYHQIPPNMSGTTLFPLNQMKDIFPEIYHTEFKKYEWRQEVPKQQIPQLNCLWNDVIFLFAVHPKEINNALTKAGLAPLKNSYYEIPLEQFDQSCMSIWSCIFEGNERVKNFSSFDVNQIDIYKSLGKGTYEYFRKMKETSPHRFLIYLTVPHILYKGTINIEGLNVIQL